MATSRFGLQNAYRKLTSYATTAAIACCVAGAVTASKIVTIGRTSGDVVSECTAAGANGALLSDVLSQTHNTHLILTGVL